MHCAGEVRSTRKISTYRMESRHVHGVDVDVDSKGDIYAGLTQDRSVDKRGVSGGVRPSPPQARPEPSAPAGSAYWLCQ